MYIYDRAMKERIKNKLKDSKKFSQLKSKTENNETENAEANADAEAEEYYLGKDRDEERKRKAYVIFVYYYMSYNIGSRWIDDIWCVFMKKSHFAAYFILL